MKTIVIRHIKNKDLQGFAEIDVDQHTPIPDSAVVPILIHNSSGEVVDGLLWFEQHDWLPLPRWLCYVYAFISAFVHLPDYRTDIVFRIFSVDGAIDFTGEMVYDSPKQLFDNTKSLGLGFTFSLQ